MTTTLARLARCSAQFMPETVELIHCHTSEAIVAIRLASGVVLAVRAVVDVGERTTLYASETAIPYTLTSHAEAEREGDVYDANDTWQQKYDDEIKAETEKLEELFLDRVREEADEIAQELTSTLARQLDDANDTIRDLRDDLEERRGRVEELCEQIEALRAQIPA